MISSFLEERNISVLLVFHPPEAGNFGNFYDKKEKCKKLVMNEKQRRYAVITYASPSPRKIFFYENEVHRKEDGRL